MGCVLNVCLDGSQSCAWALLSVIVGFSSSSLARGVFLTIPCRLPSPLRFGLSFVLKTSRIGQSTHGMLFMM